MTQFVKGTVRLVVWILKLAPLGLLGAAWVTKGVASVTSSLLNKMDKGLAEACTLECADADELTENADAEKLAEDGCTAVDEAACPNEEDPAAHLLDPVGVKASTASLKAQDTAMISVVEMLMKKIDKLEKRLDEAKQYDLSKRDGSITSLFIANKAAADATKSPQEMTALVKKIFDDNEIDTPASRKMLVNFQRSRSWINSLTYFYNIIQKGQGNGVLNGRSVAEADETPSSTEEGVDDGEDFNLELDELMLTKAERKDYEDAKYIQDLSYRRELTKAEENRFREILARLPDLAKDYLLNNTMGPAGFGRPGDIPLLDDPYVHPDDGGGDGMGGYGKANIDWDTKVPIPPFNYKQGSHRETSAEQRKARKQELEKLRKRDTPYREIAFPKTKRGDATWEVGAMNLFASSLSDD